MANLIKFTFSIFPDSSGRVGNFFPDPGDGEKLAGTLKKKIKSISQQELFLEPKQKKRYFITVGYYHYIVGMLALVGIAVCKNERV